MFTEFLRSNPLEPLLCRGTRRLVPSAADRKAWDGIPEGFRREIRDLAAVYADVPYPFRSASGFLAFARSGGRQEDEGPYFLRRRKLCVSLLACCAFPDTDPDPVVDGIWCLCEESSWVVSAHNINPVPGCPEPAEYPLPDVRKPYIDLFSAQTGMILSLAASLLGERLDTVSPLIRARIRGEVRRRILRPFMETDDFWWMGVLRKDLNNWTPWILSNVMLCAALNPMPVKKMAALLTRACCMLDRWLDTVPADGGCDEGPGYWNMAGGALLDCLCLLETLTAGRVSFRDDPKVRNILSFPLKADMGGGWFANFADCDARPFISGERLETAGRMIGDPALTALGTRLRGTLADQLNDTPCLSRALDLLFHAPAGETASGAPGDSWLPDLQFRLVRRGKWTLACKGGHNGENHNHNDVGSFILMLDGEPAVVDAGNMAYTGKTFSKDRYTLWNVRAAWHNLPVIGGQEQREGAEHAARSVCCTPDGMELNLEDTYDPAARVRSLKRSFALSENGLTLADEGVLSGPKAVSWIFLLREKPACAGNRVRAGGLEIRFPEGLVFESEEIPVTDARMARSWPGSLWRVTLSGGQGAEFRRVFEFVSVDQEA